MPSAPKPCMPIALKIFLECTPDRYVEDYWEWLNGDPDAVRQMMNVLRDSHPKMQASRT